MANQAWLVDEVFKSVINHAPLISIDLIVENEQGEYLLGLRRNRPAQGYWFVPGGRMLKNESLDEAFKRLTKTELGIELERSQAVFQGVYEHFYEDSVFGEGVSTHYIVLAHRVKFESSAINLDEKQHSEYRWQQPSALSEIKTHKYTLEYFKKEAREKFIC